MKSDIFKYIRWVKYLLFGVGVACLVYFLWQAMRFPQPSVDYLSSVGEARGADPMLWTAFVILVAAAVAAIGFAAYKLISDPASGKRILMGAGAIIVVLAACYLFSSDEPVRTGVSGLIQNPTVLKLSDTALYALYVTIGAAFATVIVMEVRNAIVNRLNKKEKNGDK